MYSDWGQHKGIRFYLISWSKFLLVLNKIESIKANREHCSSRFCSQQQCLAIVLDYKIHNQQKNISLNNNLHTIA